MKQTFYKIKYGLKTLFRPPFTRKKVIKIVALILIIVFVINIIRKDDSSEQEEVLKTPIVFVGTVSDVRKSDEASFVGTVRAVSEAQIQSETSGRVTSVFVTPGDFVQAGVILASLENASEQATLLQAQGSYEAALASAAQSEVSVEDAQNNAISAYRDAYTTSNTAVLTKIDVFFSDPDSVLVPGVRISTNGNSSYFNNARKGLNEILKDWRERTNSVTSSDDLSFYLNEASENTKVIIELVDAFIEITSEADPGDTLDGTPVNDYATTLSASRATLNGALTSLSSAEETLRRAEIGATQNTQASLANAQVKQALGSLRSAQANYEKTIFRTPIAGTVNSLNINVGDFVNSFTQVAEVANNDALQISIFVGEKDLASFAVGSEVLINNNATGTVTSVAPAVDPLTQKTEVKIATESSSLTNGSTVTVKVDVATKIENSDDPIYIPINAIKFEASDGVIFTVENDVLVPQQVTLGNIQGTSVEIIEGITRETVFVIDARGFAEGQKVEAVRSQE